ncbi:MAG: FecR family protein [Planctomycetota bacterium]
MSPEGLSELIDSLVAGEISSDDHDILQQTLKEDSSARDAFRERMDLEVGIQTWASAEVQASSSAAAPTNRSQHTDDGSSSTRTMLLGFAVAATIAMIVGIRLSTLSNDRGQEKSLLDPGRVSDRAQVVGVIRQQDDCEWKIRPVSHAGRLALGKLSLSKGVAELRFDSGTNVTLDAPCEIDVTSPDTAQLLAGNVFVDVTELSNGFTLSTPESRIIDEGTQYGVAVGDESTEVHVFDGRVVWVSATAGMDLQSGFQERIEAGEARSFLRSTPSKFKLVTLGKLQFVRRIEQRIRDSAKGSLIAYDGFENLVGLVRRGRSGLGWSGGWQAGGRGRGPSADVVNSPHDVIFGLDRSGRRHMSLAEGCDVRRMLESPMVLTSGNGVFLSILLSRQRSRTTNEIGSLQVTLEPDLPGRGRRRHQIVSFGVTTDGFPFINSGNIITRTASRIASDRTCLYVLKLAISNRSTFPSLRVYQPDEAVDHAEPSSWTVSGQAGSAEHPPASIRVLTGENSTWHVDELNVGNTWRSVTTQYQVGMN